VEEAARRYGLDPALVDAVVRAESGYDPSATSPAGAMGLMQLMPATARALGVADPYDPVQNVHGGVRYLRGLVDRFGDVTLALAAYNAGPGAVARHGGVPPYPETRAYVERVLRAWQRARVDLGGSP
jgi:soluble lytic murein transglycosylase-like protein